MTTWLKWETEGTAKDTRAVSPWPSGALPHALMLCGRLTLASDEDLEAAVAVMEGWTCQGGMTPWDPERPRPERSGWAQRLQAPLSVI